MAELVSEWVSCQEVLFVILAYPEEVVKKVFPHHPPPLLLPPLLGDKVREES